MKFTDEQLDYLTKCADAMYSGRWRIGKDYFHALWVFLGWLKKTHTEDTEFGSFRKIDVEDEEYPF